MSAASIASIVGLVLWGSCGVIAVMVERPWDDPGSLTWRCVDALLIALYGPWILGHRIAERMKAR